MAGVAQHPERVAGKPQIDLIDPARVQRGEVEVKPLIVPRVERLPDGPRAMRVQVVPNDAKAASRLDRRRYCAGWFAEPLKTGSFLSVAS
jgi:hypothetical protein